MGGVNGAAVVRASYVVTGRVQGVGFRWFTRQAASRLGVGGWVANHDDGSVIGEVEGRPNRVEEFLAELQKGPAGSEVNEVRHQPIVALANSAVTFEIRR
jgi:acylphosphatase